MSGDWFADCVTGAFAIFNTLRLVSYFPQIVAVLRDQTGAYAISLLTWSIWIGANGSTALYGWVLLADLSLALMNGFNAACCLLVVTIVFVKRVRRASVRSQRAAQPHQANHRAGPERRSAPSFRS